MPGEQPIHRREEVEWAIERDGLDRFRARREAPKGQRVPTMVFVRDGLGWELVDIEIPKGGLGSGPNTSKSPT
jgi:hypothetical protein